MENGRNRAPKKEQEYGRDFWRVLDAMDGVKYYNHLIRRRRIILCKDTLHLTVDYKDKYIRTGNNSFINIIWTIV